MSNKELVLRALNELWVLRDPKAIERYWSPAYIQHNPLIGNGRDGLVEVLKNLNADFRYEPGIAIGEGELVAVQGRYTGWGSEPVISIEIFRVKEGRLVEHWDVTEAEVPVERTKSGNPMFTP